MALQTKTSVRGSFGTDGADIDNLIADGDIWYASPETVAEARFAVIHDAVAWHVSSDTPYSRYAERLHFDPVTLDPDTLDAVPLVPSLLFKREIAIAHPSAVEPRMTTSSGTRGGISKVPRDDTTLMRFYSGVGAGVEHMLDAAAPDVRILNLGPDLDEAEDLWIAFVMAGISVLFPTSDNFVRNGELAIHEVVDTLLAGGERVGIVGPPPLLLALADHLALRRVRPQLDSESLVLTIGGWKRASGLQVDSQTFKTQIAGALGLPPNRVRDTYNMVELNTVSMECERGRIHAPPWLWVRGRDPVDLHVVADDRPGVLSFLDPTAVSYPAFILSDDLGTVAPGTSCGCGRGGDVITILRRLRTVESRGCALKLDGTRIR